MKMTATIKSFDMQGCGTDGEAEVKGHLRRPAIVIHDRPALFKPQCHNEAFSSRKSLISAGLTAKTVPGLRDAAAARRAGTDSTFLTTQERQNPVTANRTILCPLIRWRRTPSDFTLTSGYLQEHLLVLCKTKIDIKKKNR